MSLTNIQSDTRLQLINRTVTFAGLTDIMFDRYPGDNSTKLEWHQKICLIPGTSTVALPIDNIVSLLSAHNTNSAPKRLRDKRKFKDIANANLSFVTVSGPKESPRYIPFLRDGKPIEVGTFGSKRDEKSGIYMDFRVAKLDKGIPNPKERPVLPAPWALTFTLSILPNREMKEQELYNLLVEAGIAIGIGTYRGVFGKFAVTQWD
jgi:hypothetical protein